MPQPPFLGLGNHALNFHHSPSLSSA
jgi:hypothetical protein